MDWTWREKAACKGVDVSKATFGEATPPELKQFIAEYCDRCPVAQQCLDAAFIHWGGNTYTDDLEYTVRGGYMPTQAGTKAKGRPANVYTEEEASTARDRWHAAKPAGVCSRGHKIREPEDLALRRKVGMVYAVCASCAHVSKNRGVSSHCRRGHAITGTNRMKRYEKDRNGRRRVRYRCKKCHQANGREAYERKKSGIIAA